MRSYLCLVLVFISNYAHADSSGDVSPADRYEKMGSFVEGLAPVGIDGKWGFVDSSGTLVIPAIYDHWNYFSNGLAYVKRRGLWGRIDKTGAMVHQQRLVQFSRSTSTISGIVPFIDGEKVGYQHINGKELSPAIFEDGGDFSEGLAPVKQDGKWGYINTVGQIVIRPVYQFASSFHNGLAPVLLNEKWGFINTNGVLEIQNRFDEVKQFKEGLAPVRTGFKWGYADKSGKLAIEPQFEDAFHFSSGTAMVHVNVLPPKGFRLSPITASLWIGRDGGMRYRSDGINYKGVTILVSYMGKYGLITKNRVLIDPRYELIKPPVYGDLFLFMDNGKYGYLDAAGNIAVPPDFDTAEAFGHPWAIVETSGKYGLINSSGVLTVLPSFDRLSWAASNKLTASRGMESGKLDPATGVFTPSIVETPDDTGSDTAPAMSPAEIAADMQAMLEERRLCDYAIRENYSSKDLLISCSVAELKEVTASSNNCSNCYVALAEYYAEAKSRDFNPHKSIENSETAISLDPSNPRPYKLRAEMLLYYETEAYFEHFPLAIRDYLKLVELQPEDIDNKIDACLAGSKSPGLLAPETTRAVCVLCDEALKAKRDDPMLLIARAGILAAIGEEHKAITDLDAALSLDKANTAAFRAKAEIYYSLKDWRRSAFYFSKAIENIKGRPGEDIEGIYEGRGRAYLHMKACNKAKSDFDAAGEGLRSAINLHHMAAYHWACSRDLPNTLRYVEELLILREKCEGPCYRPEEYKEFLSGLTDTAEYRELAEKYSSGPLGPQ